MKLLEKYLKVDEGKVKDRVVPAKDFLVVLQALWKAETFMDHVAKGQADLLDVKHWSNEIRKAAGILEKINMKAK